jgi:hypothetical protein
MSAALTAYELQCLGYVVQDLGGNPGLEGNFSWTNSHTNEFQNFATASNSAAGAWAAAAAHWGAQHGLQGLLSAAPSGDLTPEHLAGQYNPGGANGDGEHPLFTRAGWRHAVEEGATITGLLGLARLRDQPRGAPSAEPGDPPSEAPSGLARRPPLTLLHSARGRRRTGCRRV